MGLISDAPVWRKALFWKKESGAKNAAAPPNSDLSIIYASTDCPSDVGSGLTPRSASVPQQDVSDDENGKSMCLCFGGRLGSGDGSRSRRRSNGSWARSKRGGVSGSRLQPGGGDQKATVGSASYSTKAWSRLDSFSSVLSNCDDFRTPITRGDGSNRRNSHGGNLLVVHRSDSPHSLSRAPSCQSIDRFYSFDESDAGWEGDDVEIPSKIPEGPSMENDESYQEENRPITPVKVTISPPIGLSVFIPDSYEERLSIAKALSGQWVTILERSETLDAQYRMMGLGMIKRGVMNRLAVPLTMFLEKNDTILHCWIHTPLGIRHMTNNLVGEDAVDDDPDAGRWIGKSKVVDYVLEWYKNGSPVRALQQVRQSSKGLTSIETRCILDDKDEGQIMLYNFVMIPKGNPDGRNEANRILKCIGHDLPAPES